MTANEQDWVVIFDIKAIEDGVKNGDFKKMGGVPVLDGRNGSQVHPLYADLDQPARLQHGAGRPLHSDQRQAVAHGDRHRRKALPDVFDDKIKPRDVSSAEPELGLGPAAHRVRRQGKRLHHPVPRQPGLQVEIEKAVEAYNGKKVNPILGKIDVHYQPGHNHTSMGETKEADGKWLVSLNKFSKDRFINVGPLKPENEQLIDISGDEMKLVHDGPTFAEPHDCIIVRSDIVNPKSIWRQQRSHVGRGHARRRRTASISTGMPR